MCIGCAGTALTQSHNTSPETTEATLWLAGFVLWVMVLTHLGKRVKISVNGSQSNL